MKQIPEELLDELIDIAIDHLGTKMILKNISKRNDAVIADLARTIADAKNILYNQRNKIIITKCQDCAERRPADSHGTGVFCDELNNKISDDTDCLVPDNCPKIKISHDQGTDGEMPSGEVC